MLRIRMRGATASSVLFEKSDRPSFQFKFVMTIVTSRQEGERRGKMLDVHPLTLFGRRRAPPALTSLVAIFYIIIFTSLVAIFCIIIFTSLVAIQLILVIFDTLSVNISVMLFTYHFGHQCNKYMTMTFKT